MFCSPEPLSKQSQRPMKQWLSLKNEQNERQTDRQKRESLRERRESEREREESERRESEGERDREREMHQQTLHV